MEGRVLILNQDYSPLAVCSVERAFVLVYLDKSEMLRARNGHQLCTVRRSYPMPSVIRLNRYVSVPFKHVNLTRQNIFKRDGHCCQYCGSRHNLTLDHVLPGSRGGRHSWQNLVAACKKCNVKKGDNTPEEAGMPLAKKPYKPPFISFLKNFSGNREWDDFLIRA